VVFTLMIDNIQFGVDVEPEAALLWVLWDTIGSHPAGGARHRRAA
jgi:hypothetical protein